MQALRRTVAEMRAEDFDDIADDYEDHEFSVSGLKSSSGRTIVYLDETANVPQLGLPRDLDGDGKADNDEVDEDDYILLPVRIDVRWQGMYGTETRSLYTFFSDQS